MNSLCVCLKQAFKKRLIKSILFCVERCLKADQVTGNNLDNFAYYIESVDGLPLIEELVGNNNSVGEVSQRILAHYFLDKSDDQRMHELEPQEAPQKTVYI